MSGKLKSVLKSVAPSPDPMRKDAFIRSCRRRVGRDRIGLGRLLLIQAEYIGRRVWAVAVLVLTLCLAAIHARASNGMRIAAAMMPFVSTTAIVEALRSRIHGMDELERATRLSVRGIVFARLIVIGACHGLLILVVGMFVAGRAGYGFLMSELYLLTPYLLTSVLCLEAERTASGRKSVFSSIGISALSSLAVVLLYNRREIFARRVWPAWALCSALAMILSVYEWIRLLRTEEDRAWN